jgi:hypothetical protein
MYGHDVQGNGSKRADDMTEDTPKSKADPVTSLGIPLGPECRESDLQACRRRFETDTSNPLPAFQAVSLVAARHWHEENKESPEYAQVPMWAVEVIAAGFCIYREAAEAGQGMTLGEAFGIKGVGRGKWPRLKRDLQQDRDRKIALAVALKLPECKSVEDAVFDVAEEWDLSSDRVWHIWTEHCDLVRARLRDLDAVNRSRTPSSDLGN